MSSVIDTFYAEISATITLPHVAWKLLRLLLDPDWIWCNILPRYMSAIVSHQHNGVLHIFRCQTLSPIALCDCMQRKTSNGSTNSFQKLNTSPLKVVHLLNSYSYCHTFCKFPVYSFSCLEYDVQENRDNAEGVDFIQGSNWVSLWFLQGDSVLLEREESIVEAK